MASVASAASLYEELGVAADADLPTLRKAYRQRAMQCHPDRVDGDADLMARLNAAWAVLSDPTRRAAYDRTHRPRTSQPSWPTAGTTAAAGTTSATGATAGEPVIDLRTRMSRKQAWFAGLRMQTIRLSSEAIRSAVQALAIRHRRPRALYDVHVDQLVGALGRDIEHRVRAAREAGAAPLDLALAAALVGVRDEARHLHRRASVRGVDEALVLQAELVDRVWDHLAHGVTRELERALGGNPRLLRRLTGRRV